MRADDHTSSSMLPPHDNRAMLLMPPFKDPNPPAKFWKPDPRIDFVKVLYYQWNRYMEIAIPGMEAHNFKEYVECLPKLPVVDELDYNPGPSRRSDFNWVDDRWFTHGPVFKDAVVHKELFTKFLRPTAKPVRDDRRRLDQLQHRPEPVNQGILAGFPEAPSSYAEMFQNQLNMYFMAKSCPPETPFDQFQNAVNMIQQQHQFVIPVGERLRDDYRGATPSGIAPNYNNNFMEPHPSNFLDHQNNFMGHPSHFSGYQMNFMEHVPNAYEQPPPPVNTFVSEYTFGFDENVRPKYPTPPLDLIQKLGALNVSGNMPVGKTGDDQKVEELTNAAEPQDPQQGSLQLNPTPTPNVAAVVEPVLVAQVEPVAPEPAPVQPQPLNIQRFVGASQGDRGRFFGGHGRFGGPRMPFRHHSPFRHENWQQQRDFPTQMHRRRLEHAVEALLRGLPAESRRHRRNARRGTH